MSKLLVDDVLEVDACDESPSVRGKRTEKWFVLPAPPKRWMFAFVDDELLAELNDGVACYALTLPAMNLCLFAMSLKLRKNRADLEVAFCHELVHVGLSTLGGEHSVMQALGAKSEKAANDREEAICGIWSNNMAAPMFASKVLRLPKIPR